MQAASQEDGDEMVEMDGGHGTGGAFMEEFFEQVRVRLLIFVKQWFANSFRLLPRCCNLCPLFRASKNPNMPECVYAAEYTYLCVCCAAEFCILLLQK